MFMLEWQAPNGALAKYHRATSFQGGADATFVVVDSFHTEAMAVISWRDTYAIPAGAVLGGLADAEVLLTSSAGAFAGGTIIPVEQGDLITARALLWAEVKAARERAAAFCDTGSGRVDCSVSSRVMITGAVQMAKDALADSDWSIAWTMADNSVVTLDAAQMIAMGTAVGAHVSACWAHGQTLRAAIDAAETLEALAQIDIVSGWPGATA